METTNHLNIELEETDDVCAIHGTKKHKAIGSVFCMKCAVELVERHEKEVIEKETQKYFERDSRYMKRSLYDDDTLKKATFKTFLTVDTETTENKQKAREIAGEYLKGATFNSILTGNVGTGKSHLAMSMLKGVNEFSDPKRKCLFVSVNKLLTLLRRSYKYDDGMDYDDLVKLCKQADVLVMDDLGAEVGAIGSNRQASSDNVRLVNDIVDGRADKPTIFTTNLNRDELKETYDGRIYSRIMKGTDDSKYIIFEETTDKRNTTT